MQWIFRENTQGLGQNFCSNYSNILIIPESNELQIIKVLKFRIIAFSPAAAFVALLDENHAVLFCLKNYNQSS